ncbi:MAG: hypothetical protein Q8R82_11945 [Hyphomonadaceae bacterium]|nr:hypothetical protein [Hyphomonadaceae bacterium]
MATTIDHLESHHRYAVIRGFTDATGLRVPFEATGVIRRISLDPGYTTIFIDWERDGPNGATTPERLTFAFKATDGPRNNHMREYFEKGEVVLPAREPKAPKPAPEAEPAQRPAAESFVHLNGRQPQDEVSLNEQTVACDCGATFHRAIWPAHGDLRVNACLRCGAVTVTKQIGDDGRFTGDSWTAYLTVPIAQQTVDWLARFPRVAINHAGATWRWPMSATLVRYPTLFYPADTRVSDEQELGRLEDVLFAAQSPLTRADRQSSACGDIPAPPAGAAEQFAHFAYVQRALNLRPTSDLDTLRRHGNLISASSELAAALLLRRDGAYDIMMGWLRSKNEDEFSAGIAMLRDSRPLFSGPDDPNLAPALIEILNGLPLGQMKGVPNRVESCLKFEALLVAIADLGANSMQMQDALRALRVKIARKDPTLMEAMAIVLNELNGKDNRPEEYR